MQSLSVFYCFSWQKNNIVFQISTYCQPLIIEFFWFSYLWFRIEEKIHTKAVSDVSRGEEFWKLFCLGGWGRNGSFGGKGCLGRARGWRKLCKLTIKWASSSKTVSKDSANTSCALPTGCFLDTIYWIALQKMHISEYVCKTCLKELAIGPTLKNCSFPITRIAKKKVTLAAGKTFFLPYSN